MLALTLLMALFAASPKDKPAIPDYFKKDTPGRGRPEIIVCTLNSQDTRGQFKICRYDCGNSITVGQRSVCPFVMYR